MRNSLFKNETKYLVFIDRRSGSIHRARRVVYLLGFRARISDSGLVLRRALVPLCIDSVGFVTDDRSVI